MSLSTHRLLPSNPWELGITESLVPLSNLFGNWSLGSKVMGGNCQPDNCIILHFVRNWLKIDVQGVTGLRIQAGFDAGSLEGEGSTGVFAAAGGCDNPGEIYNMVFFSWK